MKQPIDNGTRGGAGSTHDSTVAADVALMKGGPRTRRRVIFAAILGLVFWVVAYNFYALYTLSSDLQSEGLSESNVSFVGPFRFAFTAQRPGETCSGTVTSLPLIKSWSWHCQGVQPARPTPAVAPQPPPRNVRAEVEGSLAKNYKKHGFEKFECPEIAATDRVSCSMAASNGASVPVDASVTKRGSDGLWEEWTTKPSKRVLTRENLARNLEKTLVGTFEKKGRKATPTIDCGAGPLVVSVEPLECTVKTDDRVTTGKAKVTLDQAGEDDKVTFTGI